MNASCKRSFFLFGTILAAAGLLARPAAAQEPGQWEASIFAGGSFGSRISLTPTSDSKLGIAPVWGLRFSFGIARAFALETSFSHATPDLTSKTPTTGTPIGSATKVDVNTYEVNGLFGWGRGRAKGYFGIGVGAVTLDPSSPAIGLSDTTTRFSANVALGGKYFVTDNLALRLDARYRWRVTPSRVSTVICGETGCHTFTTDLYSSSEVTAGLTYRFGPPAAAGSSISGGGSESEKNFAAAAGEVALFNVLPWAFNRYVSNAEFAHISLDTVSANFEAGFGYDRDHFSTNQSAHPYHGSLFFNSARTNGFGYWESGAFTFSGSFLWETLMEKEPPSINDLVNTTLGGMTRGEIQYRLSNVILDNTASGSDRFWREVGGAILNPVGALNRLLRGEMTKDFPNPSDRLPSSLMAVADLGYRHNNGGALHPDQGIATVTVGYGDPFASEINRPFDTFRVAIDLNAPGGTLVSRIEERGILKGWELTDAADSTRHILNVNQEYIFLSNEAQEVGGQIFSGALLSRYALSSRWLAVSQVSAMGFPIAAVRTTDFLHPLTGRNFDYGQGGGARAEGRLLYRGGEVVAIGYAAAWIHTSDGASNNNTLQFFRAIGRVPITEALGAGVGYNWYSRKTTYSGFVEPRKTQSEWRLFGSWKFF
jgi:opacity protein-like surface antigen